jgi:undecaprenyl-diphosphatase
MVVPLIFGKVAKDFASGSINFSDENFGVMSAGFLAAFIAGLLACNWMITLVKNSKLYYFSIYCFLVGAIAITYAYFYL